MLPRAGSPWVPFRYKIFTIVWTATVLSNIGGWMYNAAAGWLMTNLTSDALIVSLVQVANTLPMFLFALVAGVLSDILDKRRFLIAGEVSTAILSAIFAAMVWFNYVTPASLLWFTFFIAVAGALTSPAWQAVVPELVPRNALPAAVSANSAGVNVSRAIGPALAGAMVGPFGIAAPFVVNAVSNFGSIGALIGWREPKRTSTLPVEPFGGAIRIGFRYAANNPHLRGTLLRAVAFFFFASAYWALLPLIARSRLGGGPEIYGILLGAIGLGAVAGAFAMPSWKMRIGPDRLVAAASIGTAIALALFGIARDPALALLASVMAGISWIAAVATLNVSAQVALPDWVRGRGLAIYMTVLFGSLTFGSAVWGQLATLKGLPITLFAAMAGMLLTIPLTWRRRLQTGATVDLTPSMQWPAPIVTREVGASDGPVLVTIEYRIAEEKHRAPFLASLNLLRRERLRDGAYAWGIFEDTAERGRFLETFLVKSWVEHLRQHERVTNADSVLQQSISGLLKGEPSVTHFIAPAS
jgi:MFS family permease